MLASSYLHEQVSLDIKETGRWTANVGLTGHQPAAERHVCRALITTRNQASVRGGSAEGQRESAANQMRKVKGYLIDEADQASSAVPVLTYLAPSLRLLQA